MILRNLATAALLWPLSGVSLALAGTLSVPGTGDGFEVLQAVALAYKQVQPTASIEIPPSTGSGGGIAAVADGRAVLGRIARALTDSETGGGLSVVPVMRIPAVVFTHPSANVAGVSFAQLAAIYSGAVTNWREVGGADLRIRVVRRESEDSTLKVFRATMPGWQTLALTPNSKTAVTTQEAVDTVKETEGAIGFGPNSTALSRGLTVLKLEGLDPTASSYPSNVNVSFIFKIGSLPADAESFIDFSRSDAARAIITSLGALPWNK